MYKPSVLNKILFIFFVLLSNLAFGKENVLRNLEKVRKFYDNKHQVISKNISNANIPKKKAQNLEFDFSKISSNNKVKLSTTNATHIGVGSKNTKIKSYYPKGEKNISGNNINLKEQAEQLTENAENIKINSDLYKQLWKIVKISIGS